MTYRKITVRAVRPALLTFLSGVVLLLSFGSVAQASAKSRSTAGKPTVVLVHGAWADGSSWSGVVARLQRDGYTVDVPLTRCGAWPVIPPIWPAISRP
jgi:pimeloyl-ACP methyl ester carboxylesterase